MKKLLICCFAGLLTAGYQAQAGSGPKKTKKSKKIETVAATDSTCDAEANATVGSDAYDQLLARFTAADTTLSPLQCAEVYYGFARQPAYNGSEGYGESDAKSLLQLGKYREAFDQAKLILEECPVSLWAHEILLASGSAQQLPQEELAPYWKRFGMLLRGIRTSGNGLSRTTAFKVLGVPDEYVIMRVLGIQKPVKQTLIEGGYDQIEVEDGNIPGSKLYFDVNLALDLLRKKMMRGEIETPEY